MQAAHLPQQQDLDNEDQRFYRQLDQFQGVWQRVDEFRAAQLVMAQRRSRRPDVDRVAAWNRLWNTRALAGIYDAAWDSLTEAMRFVEAVRQHLGTGMSLVSNVRLDAAAGRGSLLAALTASPDVAVGEVLARAAGALPLKDPRGGSLSAALVSKEFQRNGNGPRGSAAIHWKQDVRRRTVHTPSPDDTHSTTNPRHGATLSSLYPLLTHGDVNAVRLALAEATQFEHDLELRRRFAAGRPATDAHFGALIHGDLRWSNVEKVVLTYWDENSRQQAQQDQEQLKYFSNKNGLRFRVSLEAVPAAEPAPGSGQDPAQPVSTVLTGGDGRPVGRDYTPPSERPAGGSSRLVTHRLHWANLTPLRDQVPGYTLREFTPPWSATGTPTPYFVMAQGSHDRITIMGGDGTTTKLSPGKFADLLAKDPALRHTAPATPVVLLVPFGGGNGLDLPRLVAARTGRQVWSASGPLDTLPSETENARHITQFKPANEQEPTGHWILSRPTDLERPDRPGSRTTPSTAMTRTVDGDAIPDSDIVTHTIIGRNHRPVGRSAHTPLDQATREPYHKELADRNHYLQGKTMADGTIMSLPGSERGVPWAADITAGRTPYFFTAHGYPEIVELQVAGGRSVRVAGSELGGYLRRRPSLSRLDPHHPIVLLSCSTGKTGPGGSDRPVAQHVADTTGRVVYAPNTSATDDLTVRTGPDGRPGNWVKFKPRTQKRGLLVSFAAKLSGRRTPANVPVPPTTSRPARALPTNSATTPQATTTLPAPPPYGLGDVPSVDRGQDHTPDTRHPAPDSDG
ncbi:lonely Cys domain-containing protein, partial [Streptomyces sp. NPDC057717]|uniref:lonely Cys domain-containing protein n=1 Tax=Streptomyces sp. NPDC057717 TaxID=3346224 RepID=UPI0036A4A456